jgi:hypothetical protein
MLQNRLVRTTSPFQCCVFFAARSTRLSCPDTSLRCPRSASAWTRLLKSSLIRPDIALRRAGINGGPPATYLGWTIKDGCHAPIA